MNLIPKPKKPHRKSNHNKSRLSRGNSEVSRMATDVGLMPRSQKFNDTVDASSDIHFDMDKEVLGDQNNSKTVKMLDS